MASSSKVDVRELAREHLVPNFTRSAAWRSEELPIIVRGEGSFVFDDHGRRFIDGLSGLFCVNIGHGRSDIVAAVATQMETLAYSPVWSSAHPTAVEAASLIATLAPGDLDAVFFVSSGSEAVESAIKFARQYHRSRGHARRTKIISRAMSYHGTTLGALSLTGIPDYREPFGPLLPDVFHVPNTNGAVLAPHCTAMELPCVQAIQEVIEREGADTIAAIFAEPVQNGGGVLVPPDGYWQALRTICDSHGILLVADEVINSFGRLGSWFGVDQFGVVPDLVTFAKGSTSGYAPLGGLVVRRTLVEQLFETPNGMFTHGATWSGHPVCTAAAIANITALRDENVLGNVTANAAGFAQGLAELSKHHQSLKEVRGMGYFYALELTAKRDDALELTPEQSKALLQRVIPMSLRKVGLLTRPDDRGATMIILAPPLVADTELLRSIVEKMDAVLSDVDDYVKEN